MGGGQHKHPLLLTLLNLQLFAVAFGINSTQKQTVE